MQSSQYHLFKRLLFPAWKVWMWLCSKFAFYSGFIYLKGRVAKREGERWERISTCWLTPQMAAMIRAEAGQTQELETLSTSCMWAAGVQAPGPLSPAESRTGSGGVRIQTSEHMGCRHHRWWLSPFHPNCCVCNELQNRKMWVLWFYYSFSNLLWLFWISRLLSLWILESACPYLQNDSSWDFIRITCNL